MARHIFLTGTKQVGKSTLVSSVLATTKLKYSGLRSISVFDEKNDRNVYLISASKGSAETPALVGVCSQHHITQRYPKVFDDVGCRLLDFRPGTELVVIDEIGNMECDAHRYSEKILSLLDRTDLRILGVLQKMARTDLAAAIRQHPNVRMIEVTPENRDNLVLVLSELLN